LSSGILTAGSNINAGTEELEKAIAHILMSLTKRPDNRLIDVSHVVEHGLVTYPGLPSPSISDYLSRAESRKIYTGGTEFQIGKIEMIANTGTYIDAPFHRFADGADLSEIPLEKLANLDGIVLRARSSSDRAIEFANLDDHSLGGKAVLFHTGWSRHWNTAQYGKEYPFLTRKMAETLRDAGVILVGIDSVNIDDDRDGTRPAHTVLLEVGIPVVEHLTDLDLLPDRGFRFFATPVKVAGFGSFPVRAFAMLAADERPNE
jgi:arylformamidase